ncbi:hypothetical protein I5677_11410 [Mobilitalea sibirica]|uniref:Uncharacterized protein n=1 Tax=Mobilitalea sibirica TaxID=1462919 RepID=A0A8J7HBU7_9FIRM|nr:hypothetical protein [Mobilitalea sibirica]MBH1941501.1 hypothetical protein [Mobilitalea sibirica]
MMKRILSLRIFKGLKNFFIDVDLQYEISGTQENPVFYRINSEYDLNMDNQPDKIEFFLNGTLNKRNKSPYIKVNGIKLDIYMDYTYNGEVGILDLDEKDGFIELAYLDEGPSGDPHYVFYRYNGTSLYELGEIDAYSLMDGQGHLISGFHLSDVQPVFYSAWYEIMDNRFVKKNHDLSEYIGKSYEFNGGEAYFIPKDNLNDPLELRWEWEAIKNFEPTTLKLLDIHIPYDRTLNFYLVEFPNGERGLLYFWIGD